MIKGVDMIEVETIDTVTPSNCWITQLRVIGSYRPVPAFILCSASITL